MVRAEQASRNGSRLDSGSPLESLSWTQFRSMIEATNPDYLCAISRKMPRVAELLLLHMLPNCVLLSDRALPWLDRGAVNGKRIVIIDDILNNGSTVANTVRLAETAGFDEIVVRVWGIRRSNLDLSGSFIETIDFAASRELSETEYWRSQNVIPSLLTNLSKPYDLDFPILTASASPSFLELTEHERLRYLLGRFQSVYSLTTPTQRSNGIEAYSLIDPHVDGFQLHHTYSKCANDYSPIKKIRFILDHSSSQIRFVPMCIAPLSSSNLVESEGMSFTSEALSALYHDLSSKALPTPLFKLEAHYRFALYLMSCDYLLCLIAEYHEVFSTICRDALTCNNLDLQLLFGPDIALIVKHSLDNVFPHELNSKELSAVSQSQAYSSNIPIPIQHIDLNRNPCALNQSGYKPEQIICSELNELAEDVTRRTRTKGSNELANSHRYLREGFTPFQMQEMLSSNGFDYCNKAFSALLDFLIDRGIIVPVTNCEEDTYFRLYRRGEYSEAQLKESTYRMLREYVSEQKPIKGISKVVLEKSLAAIAIFHPATFVPLTLVFDEFGATACVAREMALDGSKLPERVIKIMLSEKYIVVKPDRERETAELPFEDEPGL